MKITPEAWVCVIIANVWAAQGHWGSALFWVALSVLHVALTWYWQRREP